MRKPSSTMLLASLIALYVLVMGTLVLLRHDQFQTQAWDMGIFDQTFWNTVHGRVMQNSLEEIPNHLGIHMSPFLFLLVPGYALFPSPYFLLIAQLLALAFGAIPLYFLTRRLLGNDRWALLLVVAYLLYPPLHWVNWFDFHEIAFFVPLLLAGVYYAQTRRWFPAWTFLMLATSTKEDAILATAAVGLWLFVKRTAPAAPHERTSIWTPERKQGLALMVALIAYFLIATKLIMPALGGGLLRLDRYAELGDTPAKIIHTIVARPLHTAAIAFTPEKLGYVFWLFLPLGFLPLLAPRALVLLAPGIAENLLTTFAPQFSGMYQYDALIIGGLFIAAIYGLKTARARWPHYEKIMMGILAAAILFAFLLRSPISPLSFPAGFFRLDAQRDAYRALLKNIPQEASVAAHTNLVPHLTHRERVYTLGQEPVPADIVLIDGGDYFGFRDADAFQRYADSYAMSGNYKITILSDRYFVFTRKTDAR